VLISAIGNWMRRILTVLARSRMECTTYTCFKL